MVRFVNYENGNDPALNNAEEELVDTKEEEKEMKRLAPILQQSIDELSPSGSNKENMDFSTPEPEPAPVPTIFRRLPLRDQRVGESDDEFLFPLIHRSTKLGDGARNGDHNAMPPEELYLPTLDEDWNGRPVNSNLIDSPRGVVDDADGQLFPLYPEQALLRLAPRITSSNNHNNNFLVPEGNDLSTAPTTPTHVYGESLFETANSKPLGDDLSDISRTYESMPVSLEDMFESLLAEQQHYFADPVYIPAQHREMFRQPPAFDGRPPEQVQIALNLSTKSKNSSSHTSPAATEITMFEEGGCEEKKEEDDGSANEFSEVSSLSSLQSQVAIQTSPRPTNVLQHRLPSTQSRRVRQEASFESGAEECKDAEEEEEEEEEEEMSLPVARPPTPPRPSRRKQVSWAVTPTCHGGSNGDVAPSHTRSSSYEELNSVSSTNASDALIDWFTDLFKCGGSGTSRNNNKISNTSSSSFFCVQ